VAQGLAGAERIFEVLDTKPDIISPLVIILLGFLISS
jgi:hypothetical protein